MKFSSALMLASTAFAAPFFNSNSTEALFETGVGAYGWSEPTFPTLHHSCDGNKARMINAALKDTIEAVAYAKQRVLDYGSDDDIFKRWFGSSGSPYEVIGLMDWVAEGNKEHVLLRCDDVDNLCAENPGYYAGHHRTDVPDETVVCDYFFESRKSLDKICFNSTIVETGATKFGGLDFIHRYFHVPRLSSNDLIGHYAEGMEEMLDLAENNSTFATKSVDNIIYFVADAYASAVIPGGCIGDVFNAPADDG